MKPYSIFLPLILFAGSFLTLNAQVKQPERTEIADLSEAVGFNIIPIGKEGVLSFYLDKDTKGDDQEIWIFKKLDSDLKEQWKKTYPVDKGKGFKGSDFNNGSLYLFFQDYRHGNFSILIINTLTNQLTEYEDEFDGKFNSEDFKVNKGVAYFTGVLKHDPVLFNIDLATKKRNQFPLEAYGKHISLENIEYDDDADAINVAIAVYDKKERKFIVKTIAANGSTNQDFVLGAQAEDKWLLNASVRPLKDNKHLVIGTYSSSKAGASQGIYVGKFTQSNKDFIKFYSFTEFQNFFNYLPQKQQERIEKKIEAKKEAGKEFDVNYRLLVHDIIEKDNQYLFLGESYYPVYHTESRLVTKMESYPVRGSNGYTTYQSRMVTVTEYKRVFDGYRFTHAVVAGFDTQGNKLWDNCFEMGDVLTFWLKQKIKVEMLDGKVGMVYLVGNSIQSKYIEGNNVVEGKKAKPFETGIEGDKLRYTIGSIEFWYDNYFILWGYQKIKNPDKEDKVRKIYFASKIAY